MDWADVIVQGSMSFAEMAEMLELTTEATAEEIIEIANYLGYTFDSTVGTFIRTNYTTIEEATVAATEGASVAWAKYMATGGTATGAIGAALNSSKIASFANTTLAALSSGAAAIQGVLSITLPTALAAVAPLAGVALGYVGGKKLYEANPQFWSKVSRFLFETVPDAFHSSIDGITQYVKGTVDKNGQVYLPLELIEALKQWFIDEGYIGNNSLTILDGNTATCHGFMSVSEAMHLIVDSGIMVQEMCYYFADDVVSYINSIEKGNLFNISFYSTWTWLASSGTGAYYMHFVDEDPITVYNATSGSVIQYGYYNKTRYYGFYISRGNAVESNSTLVKDIVYNDIRYRLWFKNYGVQNSASCYVNLNSTNPISSYSDGTWQIRCFGWTTSTPTKELPDGVTTWEGQEVDPTPGTRIAKVANPNPDNEDDWYPMAPTKLPSIPGITIDPTEDPTEETDPEIIDPYINPNPEFPDDYPEDEDLPSTDEPTTLPNPTTVPTVTDDPNTDPDVDPSDSPDSNDGDPSPQYTPDNTGETPDEEIPVVDPIISSATGLFTVYRPDAETVKEFGQWLWTTFSGDLLDTLSKLFNNSPLDAVIGFHELYAAPTIDGNANIKCGYLDSGISAPLIKQRYFTLNFGSLIIPEYWGNYLDYEPYTSATVYLPFIGYNRLNANDIVGNAVEIKYTIDAFTGSCIAQIIVARGDITNISDDPAQEEYKTSYKAVKYQFSGNCGVEIPLTAGSRMNQITGLIGTTASLLGGGNPIGAAIKLAHNPKPDVAHSGSFSSTFGAMGIKSPFIIIERPVQKVVPEFAKAYGNPAYKKVSVSWLMKHSGGYMRVKEVEIVSTTATDEEKQMIEQLLKEGIYVTPRA